MGKSSLGGLFFSLLRQIIKIWREEKTSCAKRKGGRKFRSILTQRSSGSKSVYGLVRIVVTNDSQTRLGFEGH